MKRFLLYSIIFAIFLTPSLAQGNTSKPDWLNKIAAYQMAVEELEKLISSVPDKELSRKDYNVYLLREGSLSLAFSLGRCVSGMYGKWDLEKGVIIEASFHPEKWRDISYYEKNVKSLKKSYGNMFVYYRNDEKGFIYTMQHGKVSSITFTAAENINPVKCKD